MNIEEEIEIKEHFDVKKGESGYVVWIPKVQGKTKRGRSGLKLEI